MSLKKIISFDNKIGYDTYQIKKGRPKKWPVELSRRKGLLSPIYQNFVLSPIGCSGSLQNNRPSNLQRTQLLHFISTFTLTNWQVLQQNTE